MSPTLAAPTLMDTIHHYGMGALAFIATIWIVVTIHEMGHFLVARWNGIRVETFSIGMGREIIGFTDRKGTRWKLSMIPVGGYVKFFGDEDGTSGRSRSDLTEEERKVSFFAQSLPRRAAVVAAGPLANLILAVLIIAAFDLGLGKPITPSVVGEVIKDSAAESAGLRVGDRIVSVDGYAVSEFTDLRRLIVLYGTGGELVVSYERGGQTLTTTVHPKMTKEEGHIIPIVGIRADPSKFEIQHFGPVGALRDGVEECYSMISSSLVAIGQMFSGTRSATELGGPVGIAQASADAAATGVLGWVSFIALLSVNLGFLNLLPIPILDGGHLLIFAIEGISRRTLTDKAKEVGFGLGLLVIFGIMVFATWNDIVRIVQG